MESLPAIKSRIHIEMLTCCLRIVFFKYTLSFLIARMTLLIVELWLAYHRWTYTQTSTVVQCKIKYNI